MRSSQRPPGQRAGSETAPICDAWRVALPELRGTRCLLRELQPADAVSLFTVLAGDEVTRYVSPPPGNVEGFERFIAWTHRQRASGASLAFAIVPHGAKVAVGVLQLRALEPGFATAEWGFVIGSPFWGKGLFRDAAALFVEFAFETVGTHRLEARAVTENHRGNQALDRLGAVREGLLRRSFLRDGRYYDQALWAILDDDYRRAKAARIDRTPDRSPS